MTSTIQKLKTEGKYLGFSDSLGYVYKLNGKLYVYNRDGISKISQINVAL